MATNTATITGKAGPGLTVTATVLNNVTDIDFNLVGYVLTITGSGYRQEFDLYNTATVTYTISSKIATVTISQ
jgi:hypothetical protein